MNSFAEIREQVLELLQRESRVAYRVLKRLFSLDDEYIEDLKADLIDAKRLAVDEDGKVLVWVGQGSLESSVQSLESKPFPSPDARPETDQLHATPSGRAHSRGTNRARST